MESTSFFALGLFASIVLYFIVGGIAGKKIKNTDDYYVAGRNAPTVLIVGSLVASFLGTGMFMGDVGEMYSGFFMPILIVSVMATAGYPLGAALFGRFLRRSECNTVSEYFGKRFCSKPLRVLAGITTIITAIVYTLSCMQAIGTLMNAITGIDYTACIVIAWACFTSFVVFSGSKGVLITDTLMFSIFTAAVIIAIPFISDGAGGWTNAIQSLANNTDVPGIISWCGNLDYMYQNGWENFIWAVTYGIVWAVVIMVGPWQTSRYLMAKNEHVVVRSAVGAAIGVLIANTLVAFCAVFIRVINPDLIPTQAMIWASMNVVPTVVGVLVLTGILAAGISSASTFLSLIGFSITNDLFTIKSDKALIYARIAMIAGSLIVLLLAIFNPPQIWWMMYFGVTIIAASWGPVAILSVWSKRITKRGAFLGMLLGFVGAFAMKFYATVFDVTFPLALDPFFVGIYCSILGIIIGSFTSEVSNEELLQRKALFVMPDGELNDHEITTTKRYVVVYMGFAVLVTLFFIFAYAIPYLTA